MVFAVTKSMEIFDTSGKYGTEILPDATGAWEEDGEGGVEGCECAWMRGCVKRG